MLVEKEVNFEGKIVAVKMISGDELLARCVQDEHSKKSKILKVKQPLSLTIGNPRQTEDGVTRVTFTPWMLSLGPEEIITIKSDHVLFLAEAGENAIMKYEKAISRT